MDLVRDAPVGQLIRLLSGNRLLQYPEERADLELPEAWLELVRDSKAFASELAIDQNDMSAGTIVPPIHIGSAKSEPSATDIEASETNEKQVNQRKAEEEGQSYLTESSNVSTKIADIIRHSQEHPGHERSRGDRMALTELQAGADEMNPHNWSKKKRGVVTGIIFIYTVVVYSASAIYTSSEGGIEKAFGVTSIDASLGLSMYVLGYGVGPLVLSPLSEIAVIGRNPVYIVTMALVSWVSLPGFGPPPTTDQLPRIWWVMSGLMSIFPLHAAGEDWGAESSFENTASHVISSYIPTIKALKYARDKNASNESGEGRSFLIASMPETEGMRPLRVAGEVAAVKQCATSFQIDRAVAADTPSRELVLEELKSARIAHFICHGTLDINNPSDSCLLFKQDPDDGKAGRLRVRDVAALSMEHAHIAYLSACSTAETADKTLVDETIHLASSFQLAGFPHVVGTTWEANNTVAEKIAKSFYTFLIEHEQAFLGDDRNVAYALQESVKAYWSQSKGRFKPSDDVIAWAPFIHIGM
ncbi:CHAT domain-containing protein [Trichoderma chlorosporum]